MILTEEEQRKTKLLGGIRVSLISLKKHISTGQGLNPRLRRQ